MKIVTSKPGKVALAVALGALLTSGAFAQPSQTLPPVHKNGAVEYLSGGIGQDESAAMEMASRQWPLTLEFASRDKGHADFAADVQVLVRDDKGRAALNTTSDGPFLLAKLAPGRYTVEATLVGKTLHQNILLKAGQPAKAVFVWPAGTDEADS